MNATELNKMLNGPDLSPLQKKLRGKKNLPLSVQNATTPEVELRRLVKEHRALTQQAVGLEHKATPHEREDGTVVLPKFAGDTCNELKAFAKVLRKKADGLKVQMLRELRQIDVYQHFLKHVYGCGPVTAAYIVATIDVEVKEPLASTKPSALVQFCGLGVANGRLSRLEKGETRKFCAHMRSTIFSMFQSMSKERGLHGKTSKYMDIWDATKGRLLQDARVSDGRIKTEAGKDFTAKAHAHAAGWHVAARVFLEDLYVIWRTLKGLPVWPSYYAGKLGYGHMGKIVVNEPKLLTLDEAKALVGNVGGVLVEAAAE